MQNQKNAGGGGGPIQFLNVFKTFLTQRLEKGVFNVVML